MHNGRKSSLRASLKRLGRLLEEAGACLADIADELDEGVEESTPAAATSLSPLDDGVVVAEAADELRTVPEGFAASAQVSPEAATGERDRFGTSTRPPPPWSTLLDAAAGIIAHAPARLWRLEDLLDAATKKLDLSATDLDAGDMASSFRVQASSDERFVLRDDGRIHSPASAWRRGNPPAAAVDEPDEPLTPIDALSEEIDLVSPGIGGLGKMRRTAQIAVWAGRARLLQDREAEAPGGGGRAAKQIKGIFGQLTGLTRTFDCDWVDALTPTWSADWEVYVRINQAILNGRPPPAFDDERIREYERAILRGLLLPHRRVRRDEAHPLIEEAAEVLDETDSLMAAVIERFGRPEGLARRRDGLGAKRPTITEEPVSVERFRPSAAVLDLTRGRRVLLVGGQGERQYHRERLAESLEVEKLDWVTSERGQASQYEPLAERVRAGSYDLVMFLVSFSSHKAEPFLRVCKGTGVPLVYLRKGCNPSSVARAVEDQLLGGPRAAAEGVGAPTLVEKPQ